MRKMGIGPSFLVVQFLVVWLLSMTCVEGHLWKPRQTERKPNNKGNKELTK